MILHSFINVVMICVFIFIIALFAISANEYVWIFINISYDGVMVIPIITQNAPFSVQRERGISMILIVSCTARSMFRYL